MEYIAGPLEYLFDLSFMRSEVLIRKERTAVVAPISKSLPTLIQKTSTDQYHFNVCVYRRKNIEEENRRTSNGAFSNFLIPTWFPKLKSTITAKLLSMNNWRFTLDQCRAVDVVHLDFANAFDMVAHIFKLEIVCAHPRIIL